MNEKTYRVLDFLMVYGWVFMLILAAIGFLLYFGYLSPSSHFLLNHSINQSVSVQP